MATLMQKHEHPEGTTHYIYSTSHITFIKQDEIGTYYWCGKWIQLAHDTFGLELIPIDQDPVIKPSRHTVGYVSNRKWKYNE